MPFVTDTMPSHKVFIPVTDEMLYERPELITAPLRPYRVNEPSFHWLAVELEPAAPHELEQQPTLEDRYGHQHRDAA